MRTIPTYLAQLAVLLHVTSCASTTTPLIISERDVSVASSSPSIARVEALGAQYVARGANPKSGVVRDNAAIGEKLLLWGAGFGKQPSVLIDHEPAQVLFHVKGGGLIVQVPPGVRAQQVDLVLRNRFGETKRPITIRRNGFQLDGSQAHFFSLSASGPAKVLGHAPLPATRHGVISATGDIGYAAGGSDKLQLFSLDLTATSPSVIDKNAIPGSTIAGLAAAAAAPVVVVVSDTHLVFVDTRSTIRPALYSPHPLGALEGKVRHATLSADGKQLALLTEGDNAIHLTTTGSPTQPPKFRTVDVLPGERVPMLRSCAFSRDNNGLLCVTGDDATSLKSGEHKTKTLWVGLDGTTTGTLEVAGGIAPRALQVGLPEPTPAGTSIRDGGDTTALYIASMTSTALIVKPKSLSGKIWRVFSPTRPPQTVIDTTALLSDVVLGSKRQRLVATGIQENGAGRYEHVLVVRDGWGDAKPATTSLATSLPAIPSDRFLGIVRVQR